ncbi:dynein regulatory complex protein 1-like [Biomphalaria glabrata]|uniref:Dynein regulatory complex protein 1-like n=1 Tax=Biomphalaria glabrata TaxID=6526 RepID=A0A9U8E0Q8_BIOGL|nr:dynein regulatory complex protein 1-like [Biomphalaria glabrata]
MASSSSEEDQIGPSVNSDNMEERIAARRIRIAKRAEAARKALLGVPEEVKKEKEVIRKSRKQIEDSRQRLTKLKQDGFELVSNVRVAADAREASRRAQDDEAKRVRKEKLDSEAKSGLERFEEITKKWDLALQKDVPQTLHELLMQQKRSCDAMNEEKNKIITELQQVLKTKDDMYVKDLKKMAEDVDLIIERMNEQINHMMKAQREELEEIERSFVMERNELLEQQKKKWEEKMELRRQKEEEHLELRAKRVEDLENQLQHMRVQDAEEYNMVKIRLETDVQILEQQLQQMRATCQLNQEKLEYNFQVLKKRDDENTITKSQQKRKITRLQDVLNGLKQKLEKQEKAYRDENLQLTEDYKRITTQFHDLQRKSKHFMATDAKKLHEIWCMNEEECKILASEVLDADKAIFEQQLGLKWEAPDTHFMDNVGPLMSSGNTGGSSASKILHDIMSKATSQESGFVGIENGNDAGIYENVSASTIKKVLELLCDEGGFLVEQKLNKLLLPLEKDEQSLIKLDNIFAALGLETEEDIHKLTTYFINIREKPVKEDSKGELATEAESNDKDADSTAEEVQMILDSEVKLTQVPSDCVELIHPNEVFKALKAFVEDVRRHGKKTDQKKGQFQLITLEDRDDTLDSGYWEKYATLLSPHRERVWDALIDSLDKYHDVLKSRSGLLTDTESLRQQNTELKLLLHQYINSKVNTELQVPPTHVLQLELNPLS